MKPFFENKTYDNGIPVQVWQLSDLGFLAHWHREVELVIVCDGSIRIGIHNTEQILSKGDFYIVGSSDIHYYNSQDLHSSIIMVIFDPAFLGFRETGDGNQRFVNPCIKYLDFEKAAMGLSEEIMSSFVKIAEEYDNRHPFYEMYIKGKLLEIWTLLHRYFPTVSKGTHDNPDTFPSIKAIKAAISFLEKNYANTISLEDTASHVNLSPYYFSMLFKKVIGMNFKEYLDTIRIENAEIMIKEHSATISSIALDCGFNSISTFNRVFKSIRGYPPSKVR